MRNHRFAGLILAALVSAPAGAHSSHAHLGGFYGLLYTPAGALPAIVRVKTQRDSASRGSVEARFGRYQFRSSTRNFDNIGLSGAWNVLSRVKLGATWAHRSCGSACNGLTM